MIAATFNLPADVASASVYTDALTATNDALIFAGGDYGDFNEVAGRIDLMRQGKTTDEAERKRLTALAEQLDALVQHAKAGDEMSWSAAGELGAAIRAQVQSAEAKGSVDENLILEFLLSQYLFRSLFGYFELAPEQDQSLVSLDEKALLLQLKGRYPAPDNAGETAARSCVERSLLNLEADAVKVKPTPLVFLKCVRRLKK